MKRMTTVVAMATAIQVATGVVTAAYGDVSVEDMKCTQRYPWNGLVDIEYTIACDDPEAEIYVNPVGFNGDTGLTVFPTHFTGDGATNTVKAGKHTMVWDARADMGNLFATKNFQIKMYAGKKLSRYIVIDISGGTAADNYPIRHSIDGPDLADDTCRTTEIWMRLIPPGTFMMGSPEDELGRDNDEILHKVTLTKPFYIGVFEVTQRQWELVMGDRPSAFGTDEDYATRPVENITYERLKSGFSYRSSYVGNNNYSISVQGGVADVVESSFVGKMRKKTMCNGFDLPTDAQWEYACRAGMYGAKYDGENLAGAESDLGLSTMAIYTFNSSSSTVKVGSCLPNRYGLYDMLGNVWEMNRELWYDYGHDDVIDPLFKWTAQNESYLVLRGGGWDCYAHNCRCARRFGWKCFRMFAQSYSSRPDSFDYYSQNNIGFRLIASSNLQ